ncbi:Cytochrome P450 CYP58R1, partial [Tolypocladium paradoxum]
AFGLAGVWCRCGKYRARRGAVLLVRADCPSHLSSITMFETLLGDAQCPSLWWMGCAALASYAIWTCLYDMYWHPLSAFPGPKLAAIGNLYEFWLDVVRDGMYIFEIGRMHEKYGPIVRINSRELHIKDPNYYGSIYASGSRKVDKDPVTVRAFNVTTSIAATIDHDLHRTRRAYLARYFSKRSVVGIEPMIHDRISKLCQRLEGFLESGEAVVLDHAFGALTADVISYHMLGEHLDFLDKPDLRTIFSEAFHSVSLIYHPSRLVPGLVACLKKIPNSIVKAVFPPVADLGLLEIETKNRILSYSKNQAKIGFQPAILSALIDPDIPLEERSIDRLVDETIVFLMAGTETSSRVLSVAMFYLLNDAACLRKLREELSQLPFRPDNDYAMSQLENLPYLTAVVHESLRLTFGTAGRLPRVATNETLQYNGFKIPAGTPVSQASYFLHTDPAIFPDPYSFDPERWIKAAQDGVPLTRFLVSFTRGSRQCIGIQLSFTEMYLTLARIVSAFDMELYETTVRDVRMEYIRAVGYPRKPKNCINRRGEVMVKVTGRARPPRSVHGS